MKVLFLGINTKVFDEGAKNVSTNLAKHLSSSCDLMITHQRDIVKPATLLKALRFKPDVIMSSHGPSVKTIWLLVLLRLICRPKLVVCMATQPSSDLISAYIPKALGPDHFFVQSKTYSDVFSGKGFDCSLFPNGVDTEKFVPKTDQKKRELMRADLGVGAQDHVLLHIGPLNVNRNHELLMRLQKESKWEVVVIGSTTAPYVKHIEDGLKQAGVKVFQKYFPDISDVYAAADVYVFPVKDQTGSIEMPLTVLEAMSCDKPVVSSRFRGLPDFLEGGDAMVFFDEWEDLLENLDSVYGKTGNRAFIGDFDWKNLAKRMEESLESLLKEKQSQ